MMKSLEEHNKSRIDFRQNTSYNSGVGCDSCGEEMKYLNPHMQLASYPPKMSVSCNNERCDQFNKIKYMVV